MNASTPFLYAAEGQGNMLLLKQRDILDTEKTKSCSQAPASQKKPSSCEVYRVRHQDSEPNKQEAHGPFPLDQRVQGHQNSGHT